MDPSSPDPDSSQVEEKLAEYRRDYVIIDVREPGEYAEGHVPGAINIPLGSLEREIGNLSKERSILVVCLSGARASAASRMLQKRGYAAQVMKGGMRSWAGGLER